jgi:hypothetical protein
LRIARIQLRQQSHHDVPALRPGRSRRSDLARADIIILLLNPSLSFASYYEESQPAFKRRLELNLKQSFSEIEFPFLWLDPQFIRRLRAARGATRIVETGRNKVMHPEAAHAAVAFEDRLANLEERIGLNRLTK